jgi:CBS domain-containing protein
VARARRGLTLQPEPVPSMAEDPMNTTTNTLQVADLMTLDPVVVDADMPATEAERLIKTYRVSGLPIVSDGEVVGVVSQSDLVVARSSEMVSANWDRMRVRHLMTSPAVTVRAGTPTRRAAELMVRKHIHRLVVVDDEDRPIGILSSLDLLKVWASAAP